MKILRKTIVYESNWNDDADFNLKLNARLRECKIEPDSVVNVQQIKFDGDSIRVQVYYKDSWVRIGKLKEECIV